MPMKIWAIGDTSMTKLISKFYSCSMSSSKDNSLEPSYEFQYSNDDFSEYEDENTSQNSLPSSSNTFWDIFKYFPIKKESASMQNKKWLDISMQIIKVFVYGIFFCIVLCTGLISKFVVIFALSQLKDEKSIQFCDYYSEYQEELEARISKKGKIIWTWYIISMFLIPECFTILYAIWYFLFKKKEKLPPKEAIIILFVLETIQSIGVASLIFYSLPQLNSVDVAAICSCICFIPTILNLFIQYHKYIRATKIFIVVLASNVLAVIAQGSGTVLYSFLNYIQHPLTWILPISLLLSSSRWWYNYVTHNSYCGFINLLAKNKIDLSNNCNVLQGYIALWRCLIFISSTIVISTFKEIHIQEFFEFLGQNEYNIELIKLSNKDNIIDTIIDTTSAPLYTFLLQIFCAFVIYQVAIIAYKTQMHKFGFALPISLITPGTILLIMIFCVSREEDSCAFHNLIPDYLFLNTPKYNSMTEFLLNWHIWCWIIWWLSQIWITVQIWLGEKERLAPIEKIFYHPSYDAFLIDQFLGLNKRRHENYHVVEEVEESSDSITEFESSNSNEICDFSNPNSTLSQNTISNKRNAYVPVIYVCATMWHENKKEMNELIGSILRLDKDHCAMKVTQKYYKISINDYYELETHVMFDDAFCCMHGCIGSCNHKDSEVCINEYVATFVESMQENIKNLGILDLPPTKYPTPYGGQLVWNLPGKTRLTVHLKDKNKIRHRKRWSQVMYMYYLLGYCFMNSSTDFDTKELIAENTYILTLDGDVDFRPTAVKALLDLMKKNKELGAACGRIHPIGKGPMIWLQKFEYAIGHWLQKSTEHTIGSVLCSPGCFSLFRAKALMQHNVIAKYAIRSTEPKHYIQYDQGEDRWLCTLILQAGCKVEYCAASDAYTHAPESFEEFYIQRRRWIPSTMANIFDLLNTSRETRKLNNNISWLYVTYQWILTGSTIIGPSFIYLMMVGAFVTSFELNNWISFWCNSIPIVIFALISFFGDVHKQLIAAETISVLYGVVMMIVLIGIVLQIAADGLLAPNALLFLIVIGQFVATGFLHPQELSCLPYAIIYYITVPSMYMLLIIFSIFNLHNITWGTRESKLHRQALEQQNRKLKKSEQEGTVANKCLKSFLHNLCKCRFYTHKNSKKSEEYLEFIYNSINEINIRLKHIESTLELNNILKGNIEEKSNDQSKIYDEVKLEVSEHLNTDTESETSECTFTNNNQEDPNYVINPYWIQDEHLKNGKIDFLSYAEEEFWRQLIKKYLHPIEIDVERQQKISEGLIDIRNKCLFKFFMINTLFIVAIFLLQINKDVLHVQWPFAVKYNITFINDTHEIHILRNYMHLEPIGCLFIIAFVFILFIQFLAMLSHRFTTFIHVLANVKLSLACFNKKENLPNELVTSTHAKNIADGLQSTVEYQTIHNNRSETSSRKHKTVRELAEESQNPTKRPSNFEVVFNIKLRNPDISGFRKTISLNTPKGVLEAFEQHRSNILAEHELQSQNNAANEKEIYPKNKNSKGPVYDNPTFLNDNNE
ncbi:chitin synthase chs-2-like isoform X1 [Bombus huntii]|uniref:chitin synthase chs-2-like isoform X1 n=2 Tax=Bombus huntii TaxID=85661 RepID=UPI0021AAA61A|nr:chitin synthase chs-2-like isoform X1 [Bombus huntii]XP_050482558.1 chitin synthase chs-2-like isoform X1 [Bombus huntii]